MSSTVCQGLQSCLEPRLVEPLVLRHKLAPPKSNSSQSISWPQRPSMQPQPEQQEISNHENDSNKNKNSEIVKDESKSNHDVCGDGDRKNNNNGDLRGWSFIQALTNTSHNSKEATECDKVYVHPLEKCASSMLSIKSLEMCTESLGSETGSDISESSDEFTSYSSESQRLRAIQRLKSRQFAKKLNRTESFPPPLSSISGSDTVQVRPHREGGRLVLKAVAVSSCSSYFQAERVDGRLKICFLKDCCVDNDNEEEEEEEEEEFVEEQESVDEAEAEEEYYDDDNDDDIVVDVDDGGGDGDGNDDYWGEGIGDKSGCENEVGELPRPSRCKEGGTGNKGISNWGPLWVAIS